MFSTNADSLCCRRFSHLALPGTKSQLHISYRESSEVECHKIVSHVPGGPTRLKVGVVTNLYPTKQHFEEGTFVKDLTDQLLKAKCEVTVIHYRRNFPAMFLETLARRMQFDILDAQFIAPSGLLSGLTPKFCPLITTVHRWDILEFPYRWPTAKAWTKFVLRRADSVIAVSKHIAREIFKFCDDKEKIRIIPNAVDEARFCPLVNSSEIRHRLGVSNGMFLIFSIGRLVPIKGFQFLLRALRRVSQKHNVALVIAGDGYYRGYLESLSRSLGIADRVYFLGRIRHDDPILTELYAACDVFALTSLVEGHSIAITEAMACGKPILCSDIVGNRELVKGNFNGVLVPPNDIEKIASAIEFLVDSRELLERYGKNSRQLVLEKFSWRKRIKSVLELYQGSSPS